MVNSIAIKDHNNTVKPYMEVLILWALHVPPEKHPTENGVIAGKIVVVLFQTNKGSSQIRAAIPYLTDQIRAKVSLTLICSGLPLLD